MIRFSSLRARLVGAVFLAVAPAWLVMSFFVRATGTEQDLPWMLLAGAIGLVSLAAAWLGGELFVLRQVRGLYRAARQLAAGDLTSRTGLSHESSELGDLARTFDNLAASLENRVREREQAEKTLIARSLQQTVVSALGQFALVSNDFPALLNQASMLVAQTLEVEYSCVLELQRDNVLCLCAGVGWKHGNIGKASFLADPRTQPGFTLSAGEPVVVEDLKAESRFGGASLL